MKYVISGILIVAALAVALWWWESGTPRPLSLSSGPVATSSDATDHSTESITRPESVLLGNQCVSLELAVTRAEKVRGLSGRDQLPADHGMLFIYQTDGYPAIWMKEMNFPIDIIWLDADRQVVDTRADVSPDTYPRSFRPTGPARYVLELPAGFVLRHGVAAGTSAVFQSTGC